MIPKPASLAIYRNSEIEATFGSDAPADLDAGAEKGSCVAAGLFGSPSSRYVCGVFSSSYSTN